MPGTPEKANNPWLSTYYPLAVLAVVAGTRLPLIGNFLGEPDTARYTFGLRFWISSGPGSPSIINHDLSTGYYWLAAELARAFGVQYASFPLLLNWISLVSSVVGALALYYLSARLIDRASALAATVLVLVAPSVWWAGIQPHPQALGAALLLLSLLAFAKSVAPGTPRSRWLLQGASALCFGASLLAKSDLILLATAYPAVACLVEQASGKTRFRYASSVLRACVVSLPSLISGYLMHVAGKRLILGSAEAAAASVPIQHVGHYLALPQGAELISQAVPIFFSHGILALLWAAVGSLLWLRKDRERRTLWFAFVLLWAVPGYCVWLLIKGNNVRHLMLLPIPLFWMAAAWARSKGHRLLVAATLLVIAADFLIPPNSHLNLFPSPNVPASAGLHRQKQVLLRAAAARLLEADGPHSCYVGAFTIDHVSAFLLQEVDDRGLDVRRFSGGAFRAGVYGRDGRLVRNVDIIFASGWPLASKLSGCSSVHTLEFSSTHERVRYFGGEWGLPVMGR